MIKTLNVRYTSRKDLAVVQSEVTGYSPKNVLIQVFSGVLDQTKIQSLIEDVRDLFPGVHMIGTSTAGEIMDARPIENSILVNISLFENTTVRSFLAEQNDDLAQAGYDVGEGLQQPDTKAIVMLGCGLKNKRTINSEPLLRAIDSKFGDVLIAGGQAADNGKGEITFVFTEKGLTEHGVAAASLAGPNLVADNSYNLSWVPIGKKLTITDAEGPVVHAIDGQTPYDLYKHYLGRDVADNLPLSAVDFPLIIKRDGLDMAVHAMGVEDDGSFRYIHDFHSGEQLRFGFCHAGLLALDAQMMQSEIRSYKPQTIFVYSCVSRKWILGADITVELSSLGDLAPSAGFYSYGEYYSHTTGKPYFFSQTMTILTLAERSLEEQTDVLLEEAFAPEVEESKQFKTMRVLHRLVDKSTREVERMNYELAKLASKDSLTNLPNRRLFDDTLLMELKRQSRSESPLSLILIDIDFFKEYNDNYGHVAGDDCLRAVSLVLDRCVKRPVDTVARYGGEEFACILPSTNFDGAVMLAEEIRHGVARLGLPHSASTASTSVTISLGVLTIQDTRGVNPEVLVDTCDALLYQAKEEGRNRVASQVVESL